MYIQCNFTVITKLEFYHTIVNIYDYSNFMRYSIEYYLKKQD